MDGLKAHLAYPYYFLSILMMNYTIFSTCSELGNKPLLIICSSGSWDYFRIFEPSESTRVGGAMVYLLLSLMISHPMYLTWPDGIINGRH